MLLVASVASGFQMSDKASLATVFLVVLLFSACASYIFGFGKRKSNWMDECQQIHGKTACDLEWAAFSTKYWMQGAK